MFRLSIQRKRISAFASCILIGICKHFVNCNVEKSRKRLKNNSILSRKIIRVISLTVNYLIKFNAINILRRITSVFEISKYMEIRRNINNLHQYAFCILPLPHTRQKVANLLIWEDQNVRWHFFHSKVHQACDKFVIKRCAGVELISGVGDVTRYVRNKRKNNIQKLEIMHWLKISLILCLVGFLKEFKPSEPFYVEYMVQPWRDLTEDEVRKWFCFILSKIGVFLVLCSFGEFLVESRYFVDWCIRKWSTFDGCITCNRFIKVKWNA